MKSIEMKSYETGLKAIGIRRLSVEISLGLRSPVAIRAGEMYGGVPGKQLIKLYAAAQAYKTGKESVCERT